MLRRRNSSWRGGSIARCRRTSLACDGSRRYASATRPTSSGSGENSLTSRSKKNPSADSSSDSYAASASRARRAPETSPRSESSAWHSETARRAPRAAARGRLPGRLRAIEPSSRRKKDGWDGEFIDTVTNGSTSSFNVSTILTCACPYWAAPRCRIRIPEKRGPMALSEAERRKCVETLLNAEKEKKQAVQLSVTYPHITIEDAYAISTSVAQHKIKGGAKLIGHKVGLTSKAMQASSQINEPDYGHLLDTMMIPDGTKVSHANYCVPRVEVELAFILGKPLKGPGVGLTDVLRATEYVVPAMEILRGLTMRASTISIAGTTYSVARSTSVSPTPGPLSGLPRMKASSTSTRGTQ